MKSVSEVIRELSESDINYVTVSVGNFFACVAMYKKEELLRSITCVSSEQAEELTRHIVEDIRNLNLK